MTNNSNIVKFPNKKKEQLPDNCSNTEMYMMHEILYGDDKMKAVPDLITGQDRNRRWGLVMSFTVVPKFDDIPPNQGPTLLPKVPYRFITADSLEDLKARAHYELSKALDMAKLAVDNPEEFTRQQHEKFNAELAREVSGGQEDDMS